MVKIGGCPKNQPNTLVSAASVRWRTLAEKIYWLYLQPTGAKYGNCHNGIKPGEYILGSTVHIIGTLMTLVMKNGTVVNTTQTCVDMSGNDGTYCPFTVTKDHQ